MGGNPWYEEQLTCSAAPIFLIHLLLFSLLGVTHPFHPLQSILFYSSFSYSAHYAAQKSPTVAPFCIEPWSMVSNNQKPRKTSSTSRRRIFWRGSILSFGHRVSNRVWWAPHRHRDGLRSGIYEIYSGKAMPAVHKNLPWFEASDLSSSWCMSILCRKLTRCLTIRFQGTRSFGGGCT